MGTQAGSFYTARFRIKLVSRSIFFLSKRLAGFKQLLKAQISVGVATETLKHLVGRLRPNGMDHKSFVSH
jgi:hypothetical protein